MSEKVHGCYGDAGILDILKSLADDAEEVTVIVKSGGSCDGGGGPPSPCATEEVDSQSCGRSFCCCKHTGILCNVTKNYIVLIDCRKKIFIPLDAIAAIIDEDCCCC